MNESCKDCKVHSGMEVMLDGLCKKIQENEKISDIKLDNLKSLTLANKKEIEMLIDKLEARYDFLAKSNRDRIDQLEKEYSERKGSRLWETVIVTSMVSGGIIFIAHFLLKF